MDRGLNTHIVDANAEYRGVSVATLMGNAGKAALKAIQKKWSLKNKKVQIFCGSGNNGGDGFALAAELVKRGVNIEVVLATPVAKIRTAAAKYYFKKVPKKIVFSYSTRTKFDGDILVDALLGVGVEGKLKKPFGEIVGKLSKAHGKLVSLDIPTGNLKPDLVVAFHSSKKPQVSNFPPFIKGGLRGDFYPEVIMPIGIPKIAETHFGPGDVRVHFPRRRADSRKGENGRVVIVGGSRDFVGAPLFAGLGAIAGGADLVDLFVPEVNFAAARKMSPNFLVKSFAGDTEKLTPAAVPEILSFARKNKATIVLGCGLGRDPETQKAVLEIVKKTRQPLVLDADALLPSFVKRGWGRFANTNTILTPHAGELKRMSSSAEKLAKKLKTTVLLKGKVDTICSPTETRWNDAGNAVATVGGSGDTLAGLVGALLSRGVKPFEAAGIGTFLLGAASEQLALKYESVTPQLLAKVIPQIIRKILRAGHS